MDENNKQVLLSNISELKDKFASVGSPSDLKEINGWEAAAKRHLLTESLKDHKGMQIILDGLRNDVKEMDYLLLNSRSSDLSDIERDRVLDRKALYLHFIGIFDSTEKSLEDLSRKVEENLEANKDR